MATLLYLKRAFSRRYSRQLITALLAASMFVAGYLAGSSRPARTAYAQGGTPQELETLFRPFWETWNLLHDDFVNQPLDDVALMQGALNGMIATLDDQHTSYMTPEQFSTLNEDLSGQFEGIGASLEKDEDDGSFIIISVFDNSPAQQAGLLPDDRLIAVGGEDIRDLDAAALISWVRGPAGTPVVLTVRRSGVQGTIDITVVRGVIQLDDVNWKIVGDDIGYLRLTQFSTSSHDNLRTSLQEGLAQNPSGLVLDMRGNPGGLLNSAIDIASEFVASGAVLIEQRGDGNERIYRSNEQGLATEIPLVVLVDGGSASASELVAAAIQDYERGIILGETTFGKGTIQSWSGLSDGGGVRIPFARWLSPQGRWIHEVGLQPDVYIYVPSRPPYGTEHDLHLKAAIDLLHGQQLWVGWPLPAFDWFALETPR